MVFFQRNLTILQYFWPINLLFHYESSPSLNKQKNTLQSLLNTLKLLNMYQIDTRHSFLLHLFIVSILFIHISLELLVFALIFLFLQLESNL